MYSNNYTSEPQFDLRIMKLLGSFWNLCPMRFESKHREGKIIAYSAVHRVNICYTIALRHQLKLNYQFMNIIISDTLL